MSAEQPYLLVRRDRTGWLGPFSWPELRDMLAEPANKDLAGDYQLLREVPWGDE